MIKSSKTLSQVREIDNRKHLLPIITVVLLIFLIALFVWFLKGGSFKLYASLFFSIYFVTHKIWISVILIGILQNLIFMPLRLVGNVFRQPLKNFEGELDKFNKKQQPLIFNKKIKEGNVAITFYIFNFFVNAIAFFSAARIFLIDFYSDPLILQKKDLLYGWVPRPEYPLLGTNFNFPLFKITSTFTLPWPTIFFILGGIVLFFTALRLLWRLVRFIFKKNKKILNARIQYNKMLLTIGGFAGVAVIIAIFVLRHIPNAFEGFIFVADLTIPNPPMNFVTAVGTFITTLHAGYKNNGNDAKIARLAGIDPEIVKKVFRDKMRISVKNGLILGSGAFFITNQIPAAFELSIVTFEIMYLIYPYTFGRLITIGANKAKTITNSNPVNHDQTQTQSPDQPQT
jgi:hypothetical protein